MRIADNPCWFANSPLARLNNEVPQEDVAAARLADPSSLLLPLWRGDPLVSGDRAAFLTIAARAEFPAGAPVMILGEKEGVAYFAIDASDAADAPEAAPFAEIGAYTPLREAARRLPKDDLAIIGHARWLFDWRRRYGFCARCGGAVDFSATGAKSICRECGAEHFPRVSPVAIVLAAHDGACLLGRSPHFPPGLLSALAGFVEAGETPEEAAKRELFEEAGVVLDDIRYQFSQPWPFPCSLMMGFIADAASRDLALDETEIVEARWIDRDEIAAALAGADRDFLIPPDFTIAHQLLARWVGGEARATQ